MIVAASRLGVGWIVRVTTSTLMAAALMTSTLLTATLMIFVTMTLIVVAYDMVSSIKMSSTMGTTICGSGSLLNV